MSHIFTDASEALEGLLAELLKHGKTIPSRNGETKELLMNQFLVADPTRRYIVTPDRRVSLPAQIAETMWLLAGRDDIGWLENYLPRAKDFSDDGEIWRGAYGPRIRKWMNLHTEPRAGEVDQLAHVVNLLTEDPGTRRAVITIYDPAIDTQPGKDIPCNNWIHLISRDGHLHGHVVIRSNDVFWGWSGINQFEWSALLEIVAGLVGMKVGTLTFSVSSLHLYERHYDRAQQIIDAEYVTPNFKRAPAFKRMNTVDEPIAALDTLVQQWFRIEKMIREEPRGSAWEYMDHFPDPMMRSWLFALYAWWHDDIDTIFGCNSATRELMGTDMEYALKASPKRKKPEPVISDSQAKRPVDKFTIAPAGTTPEGTNFVDFVAQLHREKHAAYGNSWKKRGEMLGIMANIARKMDRLGVAGGGDTAADTAIDLLVYLIKYRLWIEENRPGGEDLTSDPEFVTSELKGLLGESIYHPLPDLNLITGLEKNFETLEQAITDGDPWYSKEDVLEKMIPAAYALALRTWTAEEKAKWKASNEQRIWKGYEA